MTKAQLQAELVELRAFLAKTCFEHAEEIKALNTKLFAAHAARARARFHGEQRPVQGSLITRNEGESNADFVSRMRS